MLERVPVFSGLRCIELADEQRARHLAKAPNAEVIRRHKDRQVVQINLQDQGADKPLPFPRGNPRSYSHNHETSTNPEKVWTMKRLPDSTAPVFDEVVNSCLKKAA